VTVAWDAVEGAIGYAVERRSLLGGSSDWQKIGDLDSGTTTLQDSTVEPGGVYAYRVTSFGDRQVNAGPGDEVQVSVPAIPGVPTPTPVPPKPDKKPPTVNVLEGSSVVTALKVAVLHATATDNRGIAAVEYSIAGVKRTYSAKKTGNGWEVRVPLKDRLTYLRVRARDTSGNYSPPFQAVIFRTGR
jgi:hypothetical protein